MGVESNLKMMTIRCGNRNFMQPMRSLRGGLIFSFGFLEVGEGTDFCVFSVPNVFHLVLKMLSIYQ
jgi:hypothetical protein